MKKLFALLLALGMLCSFAMAEEAEVLELSWDSVSDDVKALGSFQQVSLQDPALTLVYWVPQNMAARDVAEIGTEGLVAAFATDDDAYTISVYGLAVPSLEEYTAGVGVTEENAKLFYTNGIQAIGAELAESDIDMVIIPVTENIILVYAFTPLNGDEDWDAVKAAVVASIQLAE